ncbi:MAG: ABC transporter permease [Bacteroidota bacterium]
MQESLLHIAIGVFLTLSMGYLGRLKWPLAIYWVLMAAACWITLYRSSFSPALALAIPFLVRFYLSFLFDYKTKEISTGSVYLLLLLISIGMLEFLPNLTWLIGIIAAFEIYITISVYSSLNHRKGITLVGNAGAKVWWMFSCLLLNVVLVAALVLNHWTDLSLFIQLCCGTISLLALWLLLFEKPFESFFKPHKYEKSSVDPSDKYRIGLSIDEVFRNKAFYLSYDASLAKLAKEVHSSIHQVSQVINESKGMSFNELIAYHRIREARKMFRQSSFNHLTIEGVASEVGYASKAAFNKAFKKYTGVSPSVFRDQKVLPDKVVRTPDWEITSTTGVNYTFELLTKAQIMSSNFIKVFFRKLSRDKVLSMFNIAGLTLGTTCTIFIYLFLQDEYSYDTFIPNHDNIYRVIWKSNNPQTRTPHPMAQAMVQDFPEVIRAVSFSPWYGPGLSLDFTRIKDVASNEVYEEPGVFFADSTFLEVFQLEVVEGDPRALYSPNLVISDQLAHKYFGDSSAIGQRLELNGIPMNVAAVISAMPENSHFHFNALISYVALKEVNPNDKWMEWEDFGHFNYIRVQPEADVASLESKLLAWAGGYLNWEQEQIDYLTAGNEKFGLQPIGSIHLNSDLRWELENNGNIAYMHILIVTLVFIILISTVNYVNLTTAKAVERAKEIGIRKTLGVTSRGIYLRLYSETIMFYLLALALSFLLALALIDDFNDLAGKSFISGHLFDVSFIVKALGLSILVGSFAAFYPAMSLSSFDPSQVLKGKLTTSTKGIRLRTALVVVQFGVSAILIAGSLMIFKQVEFMKDKDLGFNKDAIIDLNVPIDVSKGGVDVVRLRSTQRRIEALSGVKATALASSLPGGQFNQHGFFLSENPDNRVDASSAMIDFGFNELMDIEIVEGRDFNQSIKTDSVQSVVINATMADRLREGLGGEGAERSIIGSKIRVDNGDPIEYQVIGVMKDFHFQSLHTTIQPLIFHVQPMGAAHLLVKLDGDSFQSVISQLETIHQEMLDSELPFEYQFLDRSLATLYDQEVKTLSVFSIFSTVALVLACLGLLGMALTVINQRIKEVGIRKILGASSGQIVQMVGIQFLKPIILALFIGLPVAYLLIQDWVQDFSYRESFGMTPYIIAAVVLLVAAAASVTSAVIKVSLSNPAIILKNE